jgi:hypothetical protein
MQPAASSRLRASGQTDNPIALFPRPAAGTTNAQRSGRACPDWLFHALGSTLNRMIFTPVWSALVRPGI